jgi:hypothetical protein
MRVVFVQPNDRAWIQYYTKQGNQHGGAFIGMPYQRGAGLGSIFRSIFRAILPMAKSAGRAVGKQALKSGANIASDLLSGRDLKETLETHGKAAAAGLLDQIAEKQKGGRKPRRIGKAGKPIKGAPKRKRVIKKKQSDQLGVYFK